MSIPLNDGLKKIFTFLTHSLFLIVPGGITALGLFLFASGRFNPLVGKDQTFFLNLMQLQALGIVAAKFGIDQVIFSRLDKGEYVALSSFFKRRVIPITFIYSLIVAFFYAEWDISLLFIITLPLEVYCIILITEHNINIRFYRSFILMLSGYPFIFVCIASAYFMGVTMHHYSLFFLFLFSSIIKTVIGTFMRVKDKRNDQADYTIQLPIQQVTNIWMFRSDQLLIATQMYTADMSKALSVTVYLFLAKLPEIGGSLLAYLSPILYKRFENNAIYFSIKKIIKDWFFWVINIGILVLFIIIYLFLDTTHYKGRAIYYFPFFLHCLLVLPANMTTYMRFKTVRLYESNRHSMVAILAGSVVAVTAIRMGSPLLLSFSVPVQLLMFISLYQLSFLRISKLSLRSKH